MNIPIGFQNHSRRRAVHRTRDFPVSFGSRLVLGKRSRDETVVDHFP